MAPQVFKGEEILKPHETAQTLKAAKVGYSAAEQNAYAIMNAATLTFDKVILGESGKRASARV